MFPYYDIEDEPQTVQELSTAQKLGILDDFASGIHKISIARNREIPMFLVNQAIEIIKTVNNKASDYMSESVIITEAIINEETQEIITPAVYNNKPISVSELASLVDLAIDGWAIGAITTVINKMIEYSKKDGSGDWAYYSALETYKYL